MAVDHFEKHEHPPGSKDWNFNVLFDGQPAVAQMAEQYAEALEHPGLYKPIPAQWLHSTILRVGLLEEFTDAEMLAVAGQLQASLAELSLPEFVFDSWWLWGSNVVFHISPDDKFNQIYDHVIAALQSVVGPNRIQTNKHGFMAHMTLAYTKTHDKEREIHQRLLAHPVKPSAFRVSHLSLIKQWPTDGHYEWEMVRNIPIGQL